MKKSKKDTSCFVIMNIVVEAKSKYGNDSIFSHGEEYKFVKVVEKVYGNPLIMIKSIKDDHKLLVNVSDDKDFIVRFN